MSSCAWTLSPVLVVTALMVSYLAGAKQQPGRHHVSGVSPATLRKIQHGDEQARNRSTLANLSRTLGFPEDHLWRVAMEGMDAAGPSRDGTGTLRREVADLQRRVAAIESVLEMNRGRASGGPK